MDNGKEFFYNGSVPVPKEVRSMKNTVLRVGGVSLTGRQLVCTCLAAVLFLGVFKGAGLLGLRSAGMVLAVTAAAPAVILGFVKKHGMDFDDWLLVREATKKFGEPVRRCRGLNAYERLERLAYCREAEEKGKLKKHKRYRRVRQGRSMPGRRIGARGKQSPDRLRVFM